MPDSNMLLQSCVHKTFIQLTNIVHRLTAPNPSFLTGSGTNTYIVGEDNFLIIDPGPAIPSHIDAILEKYGEAIKGILVTHTHRDHSPAAAVLAKETDIPLYGAISKFTELQDTGFKPDIVLEENSLISCDDFCLRAVHTPGHVDNHFVFLLEQEGYSDKKILFAGDHLMQGGTVVITPPQGNMNQYLASLNKLLDLSIDAIAPAHGTVIVDVHDEVQRIIDHRKKREQKVLDALSSTEPLSEKSLLKAVYADTPPELHLLASFSLQAHLIALGENGLASSFFDEEENITLWKKY